MRRHHHQQQHHCQAGERKRDGKKFVCNVCRLTLHYFEYYRDDNVMEKGYSKPENAMIHIYIWLGWAPYVFRGKCE